MSTNVGESVLAGTRLACVQVGLSLDPTWGYGLVYLPL